MYKRNQLSIGNIPIISSDMINRNRADNLIVTPIYYRNSIHKEVHDFEGNILDINILIEFMIILN